MTDRRPRDPLICLGREGGRQLAPLLGGKGANLARLAEMGWPVPPWYAVTTAAFCRTLASCGLGERIERRLAGLDGKGDPGAAAAQVQGWVREIELPGELAAEVRRAHAACFPEGCRVAVRSSAADEDGAHGSLAGLHETLLPVEGPDAVLAAVKRVWASAYSEAALAYRLAKGMPFDRIAMAVVVQRLVPARISGVLFTANPATGDVHEVVISSLWGLGEGLVGEGLAADRYTVDKQSSAVTVELATKHERLTVDGAGSLARQAVPAELQTASSLTSEQVLTLAHAGLEIERWLGRPQDVEFAVDDKGGLFFLQTRPVTSLEEHGPAAGNRALWDIQNWTENFPGATLPMTFSISRRLDRIGRRCFAEMFRIDPERSRAHHPAFDAYLGYVGGRICSNVVQQYRFFRMVPGFDFNRRALLALLRMGPAEIDPAMEGPEPGPLRRWLVELPALSRVLWGLARELPRVHARIDELLERTRRFHARCAAMDFRSMPPHELIAIFEEAEAELVWRWRAPLLNALFLRIEYLLLRKLCSSWCGDETGSLHNELLRGDEASESGKPVRMLLDLAAAAARDPDLAELFARSTSEELVHRIPADPRFTSFASAVEHYLNLYSFKGVSEMKLEADTLRDRPELLYRMIRSYLAQPDPTSLDPECRRERERRARQEVEERAFAGLAASRSLLPRRRLFRWLLGAVRSLDRHREDVKVMRVRLMGLFRELLRALGEWFAAEGVLATPADVFYVTWEEATDYVRGNAVTTDLRGLVALRRREAAAHQATGCAPDDRFETYGPVYHRNRFRSRQPPAAVPADGVLRGTGCCRGRVTAAIVRFDSPLEADALAGEILVLDRVHTGWIPSFPAISGLLVERGEILAHSITVAREMGIPTIVGIPGLLAAVRAGQRVTMDGTAGTIEFLNEPPAAAEGSRPVKEIAR